MTVTLTWADLQVLHAQAHPDIRAVYTTQGGKVKLVVMYLDVAAVSPVFKLDDNVTVADFLAVFSATLEVEAIAT